MSIAIDLYMKNIVESVDLAPWMKHLQWMGNESRFFCEEPGSTPYKLLAYLSSLLPGKSTVCDIGTDRGLNALALATNVHVNVVSYDFNKSVPKEASLQSLSNLTIKDVSDLAAVFGDMDAIARSQLIHFDVDPHNGVDEETFLKELIKRGYRGLVILDDIHLNPGIKRTWDWVSLPKYDATLVGHWSGSGLVVFGDLFSVREDRVVQYL